MIKTNYNNYGIYVSQPKPNLDDLKFAINNYKIKKILSLDQTVGDEIKRLIEEYKLPLIQEIFHISPGSPRGECQNLFNNINYHINEFPILIHCSAGKDRSGFAVASWLIKKGKLSPCDAVKSVQNNLGYGTGGISEISKNTMDDVLGCRSKGNDKNNSDKKELTLEEALQAFEDKSSLDDTAVSMVRDDICSMPGFGANPDKVWRNRYFPPSYDLLSPGFDYNGVPSQVQINIASRSNKIIKNSKTRKRFIKKLIKALNKDIDIDDILNKIKDSPNDPLKGLNVGQIDNYTGFANTFNLPSSAPEATRGAGAMLEGGYVQL